MGKAAGAHVQVLQRWEEAVPRLGTRVPRRTSKSIDGCARRAPHGLAWAKHQRL